MGPQANVLLSAVRISSWPFFLTTYVCLFPTHQLSPFPVRTRTCNTVDSADVWIMIRVTRCWVCHVLYCVEVHQLTLKWKSGKHKCQ